MPRDGTWDEKLVSKTLKALIERHAAGVLSIDNHMSADLHIASCLHVFSRCGLVRLVHDNGRFQEWSLTEHGTKSILTLRKIHSPRRICIKIRPTSQLEEMTIWELISTLFKSGWRHQIRNHKSPYVQGATRVWVTRRDAERISRPYLVALAKNLSPVEHYRIDAFYQALLDGRHVQKRRGGLFKMNAIAEDSWDVESDAVPVRKPRRPAAPKKKALEAVLSPRSSDSSDDSDRDKSSTSSDSRDRDKSCTSSDSSDSSSGGDEGCVAEPNSRSRYKQPPKPDCGLNHLTAVFNKAGKHVGWEARCRNPKHMGDISCRLQRRAHKDYNLDALSHMLQVWFVWGVERQARDKKQHCGKVWKQVLAAQAQGTLPANVEPVREWPQQLVTGRKRKSR